MLPRHQQDLRNEARPHQYYMLAMFLAYEQGLINYQQVVSLTVASVTSVYEAGQITHSVLQNAYNAIPNFSFFVTKAKARLRSETFPEKQFEDVLKAVDDQVEVEISPDGSLKRKGDYITPDRPNKRIPPNISPDQKTSLELSASNQDRVQHGLPPRQEGKSFLNLL